MSVQTSLKSEWNKIAPFSSTLSTPDGDNQTPFYIKSSIAKTWCRFNSLALQRFHWKRFQFFLSNVGHKVYMLLLLLLLLRLDDVSVHQHLLIKIYKQVSGEINGWGIWLEGAGASIVLITNASRTAKFQRKFAV